MILTKKGGLRVAGTIALTCVLVTASAAESITVPAGRASVVGSNATYNTATCQFGALPVASIATPPKNGSIEIRRMTGTINEGGCKGTKILGIVYVYAPRRGFRGQDSVTISETMKLGQNATMNQTINRTISITVK